MHDRSNQRHLRRVPPRLTGKERGRFDNACDSYIVAARDVADGLRAIDETDLADEVFKTMVNVAARLAELFPEQIDEYPTGNPADYDEADR